MSIRNLTKEIYLDFFSHFTNMATEVQKSKRTVQSHKFSKWWLIIKPQICLRCFVLNI